MQVFDWHCVFVGDGSLFTVAKCVLTIFFYCNDRPQFNYADVKSLVAPVCIMNFMFEPVLLICLEFISNVW